MLTVCTRSKGEKKRKWIFYVTSGCFWIYTNSGYSEHKCFQKGQYSSASNAIDDSEPMDVDFIYDKLDEAWKKTALIFSGF